MGTDAGLPAEAAPILTRSGTTGSGLSVLLVGGGGFIGSHVSEALRHAGHAVTILSRSGGTRHPDERSIAADRRDREALARALDGLRFDLTVDLAAWDDVDVERLLTVPYAALGRIVLISSGQSCLVTTAPAPYREQHAESPLIPEPAPGTADHAQWRYGVGKRRAERALLVLRDSHGVRAVVLRLPVVLGERDVSLRTWAYVERLLDGGPLLVPGGGRQPVRFVDAADVGRAVARIAEQPPRSSVYHLAQPDVLPLHDVLACMADCVGMSARIVDVAEPELEAAGLDRSCSPWSGRWVSVLDPSLAVAEWGFEAKRLAEYMPRVVRDLLEHRPDASHPGFARRARERELAAAATR